MAPQIRNLGLIVCAVSGAWHWYAAKSWRRKLQQCQAEQKDRRAAFTNDLRVLLARQQSVASLIHDMASHYNFPVTDEMPRETLRLLGENQAIVRDLYES